MRAEHPDWTDSQVRLRTIHCMNVRDCHSFNFDLERPTFSPSILFKTTGLVCHSYVQDGRIQFLGDCTHPLAGQTIELPDLD